MQVFAPVAEALPRKEEGTFVQFLA